MHLLEKIDPSKFNDARFVYRTLSQRPTGVARAPITPQRLNRVDHWTIEQHHKFTNPEKIEWVVKGWVEAACPHMLTAQSGTGKSFFGLSMALCVANGRKFFGHETVAGKVLYVGHDDSTQGYLRMIGKLMKKDPNLSRENLRLWTRRMYGPDRSTRFALDNPMHVNALAQDAKEAGIVLIVLDCFRDMHDKNENANEDMKQVMEAAYFIAEETGAAVVLIHHGSKPDKDGHYSPSRGAGSITNTANAWTHLAGTGKSSSITQVADSDGSVYQDVRVFGSKNRTGIRLEPFVFRLRWNPTDDLTEAWAVLEEARDSTPSVLPGESSSKVGEFAEGARRWFAAQPGMRATIKEAIHGLGMAVSPSTAERALMGLVEAERLSREQVGRAWTYFCTPEQAISSRQPVTSA